MTEINSKTCPSCGRELPFTEFYLYRTGGTRRRTICIKCTKIANEASRKARKSRHNASNMEETKLIGANKTCSGCKRTKDLSFFDRNSREKDGRQLYCKACRAEFNLIYTQGDK